MLIELIVEGWVLMRRILSLCIVLLNENIIYYCKNRLSQVHYVGFNAIDWVKKKTISETYQHPKIPIFELYHYNHNLYLY